MFEYIDKFFCRLVSICLYLQSTQYVAIIDDYLYVLISKYLFNIFQIFNLINNNFCLTLSPDFFKAMPRIPNKSVQQYDEGFVQSMPLPVVLEGGIVFTMEGSKVYLNIIGQLVTLGKKVSSHMKVQANRHTDSSSTDRQCDVVRINSHNLSVSLSLSLTHTHPHTHPQSLSLSHTLSLSLSHTHTHTISLLCTLGEF